MKPRLAVLPLLLIACHAALGGRAGALHVEVLEEPRPAGPTTAAAVAVDPLAPRWVAALFGDGAFVLFPFLSSRAAGASSVRRLEGRSRPRPLASLLKPTNVEKNHKIKSQPPPRAAWPSRCSRSPTPARGARPPPRATSS